MIRNSMLIIKNKAVFFLLPLLMSLHANIFSMQNQNSDLELLKKEVENIKKQQQADTTQATKLITKMLSDKTNKKAFHQISILVHPDKTDGNKKLEELFKLSSTINDQSKPQVTTGQNSKLAKAINKKIESENQLSQIKTCNDHYFKLISIATAEQAQQAYTQFFIEKNIHNAFSILFSSFVPEYAEGSSLKQELKKREEYLKDIQEMQEQLKDDIKMQQEYTESLHEAQKEIATATKQKLEKMLKKGKK